MDSSSLHRFSYMRFPLTDCGVFYSCALHCVILQPVPQFNVMAAIAMRSALACDCIHCDNVKEQTVSCRSCCKEWSENCMKLIFINSFLLVYCKVAVKLIFLNFTDREMCLRHCLEEQCLYLWTAGCIGNVQGRAEKPDDLATHLWVEPSGFSAGPYTYTKWTTMQLTVVFKTG
jgi:hypothetical protein